MKSFKHVNAGSVTEAAAVLKQYGQKARIIAGGTDLLGEMKDNITREYPEVVVNIKSIPGLDYIREEEDGLHIGPLTKLEDLANHKIAKKKYTALADAAHRTASPHIREMGTVAGNICQNNRCWYYWVADNRFDCIRKGGKICYALTGDGRYHSIFGSSRINCTPCTAACPDNIDIPGYLEQLRAGRRGEAARTLLNANPLAAITGRVCPHYCEGDCNRGEYDESVSIRGVERSLGDYVLKNSARFFKAPAKSTKKRIAIVGSGPAALSAAFFLRRAGHFVDVIERLSQPGGMLMHGIPPYRLPRDILLNQIKALEGMGIDFRTGENVDKAKFKELAAKYDAVLIACGAWKERSAAIPGEALLSSGLDFLNAYSLGKPRTARGKVGVIGAGNVAIDVARSLLRLGAEPLIIYRRTRAEMPALKEEIEKAEEEGIDFQFLSLPLQASRKNGKIMLRCSRMRLGPPDASGRPRPVPVKGADLSFEFDGVIKAIGEDPDYSFLPARYLDKDGKLKLNRENNSLDKGVFASGDFASGAATVVAAIASGRRTAGYVDSYLTHRASDPRENNIFDPSPKRFNSEYLNRVPRSPDNHLTVADRLQEPYREESLPLGSEEVETEANRCFNCGCVAVNSSDLAPVLVALNAKIKTNQRRLAAAELFTAGVDRTTVLRDDEMLVEITVPKPDAGTNSAFSKMALRKSIDFPIVNCSAAIKFQRGVVGKARICLNSIYNTPYRATEAEEYLIGKTINPENAEEAAEATVRYAFPVIDNRYKIQIARALLKRTILACRK